MDLLTVESPCPCTPHNESDLITEQHYLPFLGYSSFANDLKGNFYTSLECEFLGVGCDAHLKRSLNTVECLAFRTKASHICNYWKTPQENDGAFFIFTKAESKILILQGDKGLFQSHASTVSFMNDLSVLSQN